MDAHPVHALTLEEAAARVRKSVKTLRRWIRTGRLPTSTVTTPHGPAYRIAVEDLEHAASVVDTVKTPAVTTGLGAIIAAALAERDARWLARLEALEREIRALREELSLTQRALPAPTLPTEGASSPATVPPQEPVSAPERRGWLRRLLGV